MTRMKATGRTRTRTGNAGWWAVATLVAVAACGSDGGGGGSFDLPTAGSIGGPVLPSPRVQPIYFKGFPYATETDTFLTRLASSTYWSTVTSEYGKGSTVTVTLPAEVATKDVV